jgi:hypothetical protein
MTVDPDLSAMTRVEIEPTPAHDPVLLTIRTRPDDLRELSQLLRRKTRLWDSPSSVDEAFRTRPVEAMDPVTQRLRFIPPIFAAEPRSMPSRTAASDRSRPLV